MTHAQSMIKNEGLEKEDFFDQLTYDLAKSYEAEITRYLPTSGKSHGESRPSPPDAGHKA